MGKGIVLFFLFISVGAFAMTGQIPDKIIYEGASYNLMNNPLEKFFDQFPEKRPNATISSANLWRGYIATFEIYGSKLYLKDIIVDKKVDSTSYRTKKVSIFKEIFGNVERFNCDFYKGLLAMPRGNIVNETTGFGATYENYILLEIDKGDLIKSKTFDYKGYNDFREKQFAAYKKTEDYKKQFSEMEKMFEETNELAKSNTGDGDEVSKAPIDTEKQVENFIKIFIVDYTTKILD